MRRRPLCSSPASLSRRRGPFFNTLNFRRVQTPPLQPARTRDSGGCLGRAATCTRRLSPAAGVGWLVGLHVRTWVRSSEAHWSLDGGRPFPCPALNTRRARKALRETSEVGPGAAVRLAITSRCLSTRLSGIRMFRQHRWSLLWSHQVSENQYRHLGRYGPAKQLPRTVLAKPPVMILPAANY